MTDAPTRELERGEIIPALFPAPERKLNAAMVEIDGQDGFASGDLDDYRTNHQLEPMDEKRIVERPARFEPIAREAEVASGGKLNEPLDSFGLDHRGNIRGDGIADNSFSFESTSDFPLGTVEGLAHVIPARSHNQNRTNSGPDSFSVADRSGVETGNVGEVEHEMGGNCNNHNGRNSSISGINKEIEITQSARINSPAQVAAFDTDCPPVGKKAKPRKKRELLHLPTSGQGDLKDLMPILPTGYWFECPADDKGFKIKLRWRTGKLKGSYIFKRVGKYEFETLKEYSIEKRKWFISDRLKGELIRKGKRELAVRIGVITGNN